MVLGNKEAGYEAAGVHCTFRRISVLWSSATDAQQTQRMRWIGVLIAHPESDPLFWDYVRTFRQGLRA
jgi:hypothetical protein